MKAGDMAKHRRGVCQLLWKSENCVQWPYELWHVQWVTGKSHGQCETISLTSSNVLGGYRDSPTGEELQ